MTKKSTQKNPKNRQKSPKTHKKGIQSHPNHHQSQPTVLKPPKTTPKAISILLTILLANPISAQCLVDKCTLCANKSTYTCQKCQNLYFLRTLKSQDQKTTYNYCSSVLLPVLSAAGLLLASLLGCFLCYFCFKRAKNREIAKLKQQAAQRQMYPGTVIQRQGVPQVRQPRSPVVPRTSVPVQNSSPAKKVPNSPQRLETQQPMSTDRNLVTRASKEPVEVTSQYNPRQSNTIPARRYMEPQEPYQPETALHNLKKAHEDPSRASNNTTTVINQPTTLDEPLKPIPASSTIQPAQAVTNPQAVTKQPYISRIGPIRRSPAAGGSYVSPQRRLVTTSFAPPGRVIPVVPVTQYQSPVRIPMATTYLSPQRPPMVIQDSGGLRYPRALQGPILPPGRSIVGPVSGAYQPNQLRRRPEGYPVGGVGVPGQPVYVSPGRDQRLNGVINGAGGLNGVDRKGDGQSPQHQVVYPSGPEGGPVGDYRVNSGVDRRGYPSDGQNLPQYVSNYPNT